MMLTMLSSMERMLKQSKMLSAMFQSHGELCASRPWEVIVGMVTVTVTVMSMSMFTFNQKICGWNYACVDEEVLSSDRLILALTRCLSVMYIYLQFRNLRKLGSKYLLGIAAVFTIFSSFVFSVAVISIFGSDLSGLNEALPFFLLLIDLAKATSLAKFALSSKSQEEVIQNIGRGMALLGPTMTLDAMVEVLVIGVGTLSGVNKLETMCCFGCMSVLANYFAFMTFYPACLALFIEMSHGRPLFKLGGLPSKALEEDDHNPNPVTQRVKIIMSAGLVLVHAHCRIFAVPEEMILMEVDHLGLTYSHHMPPTQPLWAFYLQKLTTIDYTLALILTLVLGFKYVKFDSEDDLEEQFRNVDDKNDVGSTVSIQSDNTTVKPDGKPTFTIGEDGSNDDQDISLVTMAMQTEPDEEPHTPVLEQSTLKSPRSLDDCVFILQHQNGVDSLTDEEVLQLLTEKKIASYSLEKCLGDYTRAVSIRRQLLARDLPNIQALRYLPYQHYNYKYVEGACCENVVGYMPVPVGVAGPLLLDGQKYTVPMATTEGCLVASTNRGCRALALAGGVHSTLIGNGMTRAPIVRFKSAIDASHTKFWLENPDNFSVISEAFRGSSRFTKLQSIKVLQASRNLYIRFIAETGDAMGMNMVSKGAEQALKVIQELFPDMEILSLSGNVCTDKKPSAINWLDGRGKSVVCEALIPAQVIQSVLKTTTRDLVDLNINKNLIGSALAGSLGGFNAHAANIVTAIFIATGQDAAQNVCSSNCMTVMESGGENGLDLYISCSMPSIEVGTVGGGTILPPQAACLQMLGIDGACLVEPGDNAARLARIVCASVLAGELSLMSALAAGHLVRSHLRHNRSVLNMATGSPPNQSSNKYSSPVKTNAR